MNFYWGSLPEFAHMGGYGLYVWGSYAVAAAAVAVELLLLRQRRAAALAALKQHALLEEGDHDA